MNARKLGLLIVAAIVALIIAMAIQYKRQPQTADDQPVRPLAPQLRDHVSDVDRITLIGGNARTIATLERSADGWTVAEKHGYPADVGKIRELMLRLDQARLVEQKTSSPQRYAELGVDDVTNPEAKGVLIDIGGLKEPLKLIVGFYNGANEGGTFVRRDGDKQSWLVTGNLSVNGTTAEWIQDRIADIGPNRFKSVTVSLPDGRVLKVYKERPGDPNFDVADIPAGREILTSAFANQIGSTMQKLRALDVLPAKDAAPPAKVLKAEYVAFDGLIIDATAWAEGGARYAQFAARRDTAPANAPADAAKTNGNDNVAAVDDEVAALNKTFAGWTFVPAGYWYGYLNKSMDDVLKPLATTGSNAKDATLPAAKAVTAP